MENSDNNARRKNNFFPSCEFIIINVYFPNQRKNIMWRNWTDFREEEQILIVKDPITRTLS